MANKTIRALPHSRNLPNQTVYGTIQGIETIPCDFEFTNKWQHGNVVGDPTAVRSPGPGRIIAVHHTTNFGHSSAAEAGSIAALGFWYVPNSSGTLNIWVGGLLQGASAQMDGSGIGASQSTGVSIGQAVVFLGIQEFDRTPFLPGAWLSISEDSVVDFSICANASYSLDSTGGLTGPFYQTVSAPVDAQHDYACWL